MLTAKKNNKGDIAGMVAPYSMPGGSGGHLGAGAVQVAVCQNIPIMQGHKEKQKQLN